MSIYDDEIDLRPYIVALRKRWWLIGLVTILSAAAAFFISYFQTRNYEASATILLTRTRSSLALANQFPTINEPIDSRSRMDAMIEIAGSDALSMQTLDDLHQEYPDNDINREELRNAVEIASSGDTIVITALNPEPLYSAAIANSWAANAVSAINYAYSGEQLPGEIQQSLEPARLEYEIAQNELEEFLGENQVDVLQKQIDETSTVLDELIQDRTWKIAYNVRRKQQMEQVINQAEILINMLQTRQSSLAAGLGDALAVMRLRADAFGEIDIDRGVTTVGSSSSLLDEPTQDTIVMASRQPDLIFDVQIAELVESVQNGQSYQQDLERIISQAEAEKEKAEAELLELAEHSLDVGDDELLTALSIRLRTLQSQLEAETAQLNDLTSNRDLTWRAYQALAQKEIEVRNNLQTSSSVTLASPAVPSIEPANQGILRNTVIGAAIGFMLCSIWVFGSVWLRSFEETSKSE